MAGNSRSSYSTEQGTPLCVSCFPITGWACCPTAKSRLFCVLGLWDPADACSDAVMGGVEWPDKSP